MWHRWRSSHKRFSTSGNVWTIDLALMAKRFEKTVKTILKKPAEIWQKLLCHWMQPGTLNLI